MVVPSHDSSSDILVRLRAETRAEHAAIEAALDLTSPTLRQDVYRQRIEQLYGYYVPVEARLGALFGSEVISLDLAARRKTALLRADLVALGCLAPEALPLCTALPPLDDLAAGLGCLYVLEGSTLGGQVISRHLRQTLGITPETGGRFFQGYGARTGPMWLAFRSALASSSAVAQAPAGVIDGALATFRTLRAWCEERMRRAHA